MMEMHAWINQEQIIPGISDWELAGGLLALAVAVSSLRSTSPLSLLIGGRPGIYS